MQLRDLSCIVGLLFFGFDYGNIATARDHGECENETIASMCENEFKRLVGNYFMHGAMLSCYHQNFHFPKILHFRYFSNVAFQRLPVAL